MKDPGWERVRAAAYATALLAARVARRVERGSEVPDSDLHALNECTFLLLAATGNQVKAHIEKRQRKGRLVRGKTTRVEWDAPESR